jgi:DNA-binding LacI/PurR family transcriptional regulator
VSIAPVSRVISRHLDVSSQTREAVRCVIREHGLPGTRRPRSAGAHMAPIAMLSLDDASSVSGLDDTIEASIAAPGLTAVRQPLAELDRTAVSLLLRQVMFRG